MNVATSQAASKSPLVGKLLFLLIVGGALLWLARRGDEQTSGAIGHRLMQFDLEPLTGGSRWLERDDLDGKVVLMNFWGTWCPPCRAEFPHVAGIYERFKDDPEFKFLSVSCPGQDDDSLRSDTSQFMSDGGYDFQTYSDPSQSTRLGLQMVGAFEGYPTTIVLDGKGVIRGVWNRYRSGDERQMTEMIQELLGRPGREPDQHGADTASLPASLRRAL